jgi:predicted RNA-binding Zn ribbon-like protein
MFVSFRERPPSLGDDWMIESRPAPFFIADDLALDFLNTIASPRGEKLEWLATGADLLAWLEQAEAAPPDVLAQVRRRTASRGLDATASEARKLREWFRDFVSAHAGKPLGRATLSELTPLNRLLAHDDAYRQIEINDDEAIDAHGDGALRWQAKRRWERPDALLQPIAHAMCGLVCEKDFRLVRKCENPSCTLWFLDVSKAHARRWCSMAVCGNRAKVAAHRARARRA